MVSSSLRCKKRRRVLRYISMNIAMGNSAEGHGNAVQGCIWTQGLVRSGVRHARLAGPGRATGGGRLGLVHPALGEEFFKPMDVVVAVDDVFLAHQPAEQRQGGLDAVDD